MEKSSIDSPYMLRPSVAEVVHTKLGAHSAAHEILPGNGGGTEELPRWSHESRPWTKAAVTLTYQLLPPRTTT